MTTEKLFQYSVADACKELVILPTDSWEEQRAKESNAGGFIGNPYDTSDPDNNVDSIALKFERILENRLKREKRKPKTGKDPQRVFKNIQGEILDSFYPLVQLAAVEHPILSTFKIEERPLRSALYDGAEYIISGTKLAIADCLLGVGQPDRNSTFENNSDLENALKRISVLGRFQEKLIAKSTSK